MLKLRLRTPYFGGSLRRECLKALGERRRDAWKESSIAMAADRGMPTMFIAVLAIFALMAPVMGFGFDGGLLKPSEAFLLSQWQAVAGVSVLSVVFIGFVFDVFRTRGYDLFFGGFPAFVKLVWLDWLLGFGTVAIILTPAALLTSAGPNDPPTDWLADLAVVATGITFVFALPILFWRVTSVLDDDRFMALQKRRVAQLSRARVREQLVTQITTSRLKDLGYEHPLVGNGVLQRIEVGERGTIVDFRERNLIAVLRRFRQVSTDAIEIRVGIGEYVVPGDTLAALPGPQVESLSGALNRCVRVKARTRADSPAELLTGHLERLHELGMSALRDSRHHDWSLVAEHYVTAILEMVDYANSADIAFDGQVARPGFFAHGPVQQISGFIRDEIKAARNLEDSDFALEVAALPERIARSVRDLDAVGIVREMLSIYPDVYTIATT